MTGLYKSIRILATIIITGMAGIMAIFVFGALLPIWAMVLWYGREQVQNAPAHGGIILFVTVPIVGMLALFGMVPFGLFVYRKISN